MKKEHSKESVKDKVQNTFQTIGKSLGYKNVMQAPRLKKVVVSVGTGSMKDKKKLELVADRLSKITGQKPSSRPAKQSIASFKLRQGEPIGFQVTLRGPRMFGFLEKFLSIALPRTKDFRGISRGAVDSVGNITIGVKEHTIFPETTDEELKDDFGLAITLVTTAKNKKEALAFFEHIGIPLKK